MGKGRGWRWKKGEQEMGGESSVLNPGLISSSSEGSVRKEGLEVLKLGMV